VSVGNDNFIGVDAEFTVWIHGDQEEARICLPKGKG